MFNIVEHVKQYYVTQCNTRIVYGLQAQILQITYDSHFIKTSSEHCKEYARKLDATRPPVRPPVHPSACPSVRPFVRPPARPPVRTPARPSIRPSDRPNPLEVVRPFVRPFACPRVLPLARPSVRPEFKGCSWEKIFLKNIMNFHKKQY